MFKKNAAKQATIRASRWLLFVGFRDINAAERWATSEHFYLHAGYPHSKTVPSLSPFRPPKAFDPVNIITGESARAARQRDSTMRENCREEDESSRYRQQFGAKVMLMFSEPLPTWARRWRFLSLLIYFTRRLWQRRQKWGSTWSSRSCWRNLSTVLWPVQ